MIIDISPPLGESTAVWPGDTPLSRSWQLKLSEGANIDLSSLTTSVHIGAHADAPSHYRQGAADISQVSLEPYLGPCQVIRILNNPQIDRKQLELALRGVDPVPPRILVATESFPDPTQFNEDFSYFTPEAISYLAAQGVVLVGIDTPSVDSFSSKTLKTHQALIRHDMRNLEGLALSHVEAGCYELIALPLPLAGFDASPVRAVLRQLLA